MPYLIAYDIADPRRLARVARLMERHGLRLQKSVFLFRGQESAVGALMNQAGRFLDPEQDVVQAWKLSTGQPLHGVVRGTPLPRRPAAVICEGGTEIYLPEND